MPAKTNNFPGRISDGWLALAGGTNNGVAPNLINPNQDAFAINTAHRGGWPHPRPGYAKITLDFQGEDDSEISFQNLLFQEVFGYQNDVGAASLIAMIGGRQYQILIDNDREFLVNEITIDGDLNNPTLPMAWGIQAENYALIQDGQSGCWIFDGASARRALPNQVPVGNQMAYYQGRVWVAKGRNYVAGNQVFDPSGGGTASLQYRDSMLWFTENQFLAGGRSVQRSKSIGSNYRVQADSIGEYRSGSGRAYCDHHYQRLRHDCSHRPITMAEYHVSGATHDSTESGRILSGLFGKLGRGHFLPHPVWNQQHRLRGAQSGANWKPGSQQ